MLRYFINRFLHSLLTLAIIITVVFFLLRLMPIEGYFDNFDKLTPTQINNKLELMGLNAPLHQQLFRFVNNLMHGDFGISTRYRVGIPITEIIKPKLLCSLKFGVSSIIISLPLGMLLGVIMACGKGKLADKLGNGYVVFIQAIPNAVYFLFIQLYGTKLLDCSMLYRPSDAKTTIMPILSLALPSIANYGMWLRRYMLDEANKDYIKLARAKGVPNSMIWFRHVFRNSIVPMVQLIPSSILMTISGSIYVESLYSIPGMGGLLVDVIKQQDNNMIQALVIIYSVMGILGLLLGDILMGLVDPRVSFSKKEDSR